MGLAGRRGLSLLFGAIVGVTAQGQDTGAALGAMLFGAPLGAMFGLVLGALSRLLPSKGKS